MNNRIEDSNWDNHTWVERNRNDPLIRVTLRQLVRERDIALHNHKYQEQSERRKTHKFTLSIERAGTELLARCYASLVRSQRFPYNPSLWNKVNRTAGSIDHTCMTVCNRSSASLRSDERTMLTRKRRVFGRMDQGRK